MSFLILTNSIFVYTNSNEEEHEKRPKKLAPGVPLVNRPLSGIYDDSGAADYPSPMPTRRKNSLVRQRIERIEKTPLKAPIGLTHDNDNNDDNADGNNNISNRRHSGVAVICTNSVEIPFLGGWRPFEPTCHGKLNEFCFYF